MCSSLLLLRFFIILEAPRFLDAETSLDLSLGWQVSPPRAISSYSVKELTESQCGRSEISDH
jgi:hypothetical protein